MKKSKYPRLRTKVYRGVGGQCWSYYVYDMRGTGNPDVRLGTDYAKAIEQWRKLYEHMPLTLGRLQEAFDRWRERELPQYDNSETRASYQRHLGRLEPVFGNAAWHEVTLPALRQYLDKRSAKTQGNRELSVLSIIWGKARLWGMTALPWPAAGVKDWKNPEKARTFEVTDGLFAAVYEQADRILRDCMDIATATGMRITDARTVRMPFDGKLRFKAAKTGKWAFFEISQSPVLSALLERREASRAECVMLLATDTGREVTSTMLRDRWDIARERAALAYPKLAAGIRAMYLRDMRKRAADLADDTDAASRLLQHSSARLTSEHYRTRATKLKAVR
jgi:hypothetical protein